MNYRTSLGNAENGGVPGENVMNGCGTRRGHVQCDKILSAQWMHDNEFVLRELDPTGQLKDLTNQFFNII